MNDFHPDLATIERPAPETFSIPLAFGPMNPDNGTAPVYVYTLEAPDYLSVIGWVFFSEEERAWRARPGMPDRRIELARFPERDAAAEALAGWWTE